MEECTHEVHRETEIMSGLEEVTLAQNITTECMPAESTMAMSGNVEQGKFINKFKANYILAPLFSAFYSISDA